MGWEERRARLEESAADLQDHAAREVWFEISDESAGELAADIRAALERDEEHGDAWLKLWNEHQASKAECAALTRERDEAREQLTCIDLWLRRREPVARESATLRSVQEFIERAEAEVKRLRSKLAKVVEICESSREKSYDAGMITLAITLLATVREGE